MADVSNFGCLLRLRWARGVAALSAALVASCAARPFQGDTGIRPFAFNLWDVHCPSGLRVVFERTPGSPVAGVTTLVGVGARQDPPGREGLAHLVEHLAFRAHGPDKQPMKVRLWQIGASYNAMTGFESTTYVSTLPRQNLSALLRVEAERLLNPLAGVDEATFAVERDVVRNEHRLHHETAMWSEAATSLSKAVFRPDHPYSRSVSGTHASLSALTLDDARRYVAQNYRPADMTMVVFGDIDLKGAEEYIRKVLPPALYGDPAHRVAVHAAEPAPAGAPPPPAAPKQLPATQVPVVTPEVWIGWSLPGGYGANRFAAELWGVLANSNFHWGEVDDTDVSSVDFFVMPDLLASTFVCRIRLLEGTHPEESMKKVMAELPWAGGDELFLKQRFEAIKLIALRELAAVAESAAGRSQVRAHYVHFGGGLAAFGAAIESVKSVDAGSARRFATSYLGADRARAILLQPTAKDARPPTPIPAAQDIETLVATTPLPPTTLRDLAGVRHLDGLRAAKLPNGMDLIVLRRPGASVVTATLAFHGGDAAAGPGVADAGSEALQFHYEESPGGFGIGLGFWSDRDRSGATVRAGAGNLARALDMLSFAIRSYDVEWPSSKFAKTKQPLLRRLDASAEARSARAFRGALLGGHPYGESPTADQNRRRQAGGDRRLVRADGEPGQRRAGDRRGHGSRGGRGRGARRVRGLERRRDRGGAAAAGLRVASARARGQGRRRGAGGLGRGRRRRRERRGLGDARGRRDRHAPARRQPDHAAPRLPASTDGRARRGDLRHGRQPGAGRALAAAARGDWVDLRRVARRGHVAGRHVHFANGGDRRQWAAAAGAGDPARFLGQSAGRVRRGRRGARERDQHGVRGPPLPDLRGAGVRAGATLEQRVGARRDRRSAGVLRGGPQGRHRCHAARLRAGPGSGHDRR